MYMFVAACAISSLIPPKLRWPPWTEDIGAGLVRPLCPPVARGQKGREELPPAAAAPGHLCGRRQGP